MVFISNSLQTQISQTLNSGQPLTSLLKVGQVLTANIQKIQGNQVQLTIGNQTLTATSKEPSLTLGTVQIKVNQTQPTIALSIINTSTTPAGQITQQNLQSAYRQFMPNQTGLSQAFQQVSLLQNLPSSLLAPVNQLLEQVLKPYGNLSTRDLKNRLTESGLFLESKIKNGKKEALSTDVKAQLLNLKQLAETQNIKSPSPQLSKLINVTTQAINRVTVQQLQLYENPFVTSLDMPFNLTADNKSRDHLEFRRNDNQSPASWEVLLDIQLPEGALSTKLTINSIEQIYCQIWCENKSLEKRVADNIPLLETQFKDSALKLKNIQIVKQKPIKTEKTTQIALIDIVI